MWETDVEGQPRDPGIAGGRLWVASQETGILSALAADTGEIQERWELAPGIWTAEGAAGAVWVLNFGERGVYRIDAGKAG
jgi:hypothetical protein